MTQVDRFDMFLRQKFKLLYECCVFKVLQYIIQCCFNVKPSTMNQCLVLNFESLLSLRHSTLRQCFELPGKIWSDPSRIHNCIQQTGLSPNRGPWPFTFFVENAHTPYA